MATYPIILHHFENSPFSEKVRVVFGIKQIAWSSVLIPRIMPRPDLMPLTGGDRRTPTFQKCAGIFFVTQKIFFGLGSRFSAPNLFFGGKAGVGGGVGMWGGRRCFLNIHNL